MIQEKIDSRIPKDKLIYYSKIDLENFDNLEKIELIVKDFSCLLEKLMKFENEGVKLSYLERKLIYENTPRTYRIKLFRNNTEYKDFVFADLFKIFLAPKINQDPYNVSYILFSEKIEQNQLLELLNDFENEFLTEILLNNNFFKNNNLLLDGVKSEYKEYLKELKKENINGSIEDVLIFKYLYLLLFEYFEETNNENYFVVIGNIKVKISEKSQFHIMFRHYFAILKRNQYFLNKSFFLPNLSFYDLFDFFNELATSFNDSFTSFNNKSLDFQYKEKFYKIIIGNNGNINNPENIIETFHPLDDETILSELVFKPSKTINDFIFYYDE